MGHLQSRARGCPNTKKRHFTGFLSGGAAASLLAEAHAIHPQGPEEKAFPKGRRARTFAALDHMQKVVSELNLSFAGGDGPDPTPKCS